MRRQHRPAVSAPTLARRTCGRLSDSLLRFDRQAVEQKVPQAPRVPTVLEGLLDASREDELLGSSVDLEDLLPIIVRDSADPHSMALSRQRPIGPGRAMNRCVKSESTASAS